MNIGCSWPSRIALSIKEQISEEDLIGADAWEEIQSICLNTVKDLKMILSTLEDFQTKKLCVNQKKRKPTVFGL